MFKRFIEVMLTVLFAVFFPFMLIIGSVLYPFEYVFFGSSEPYLFALAQKIYDKLDKKFYS